MSKQFDTKAFLEFVKAQPADETYGPSNPCACALAQFGQEIGRHDFVGVAILSDVVSDQVERAILNDGRVSTFGALASRLEALGEV